MNLSESNFICHVNVPDNRSCNKLREHADIKKEIEIILLIIHIFSVNVNDIAQCLEGIERNTDRQNKVCIWLMQPYWTLIPWKKSYDQPRQHIKRQRHYLLHEGAGKSSGYERLPGLGNLVVSNTGLGAGDVLFIVSNSGRNCVPIDAALEAKKRGAVTVAITSMAHTTKSTSRHSSGLNLYQVCDYVLDNGAEEGDASVELPGLDQKIAPTSSVTDITLVHLILVNTVELLLQKGIIPPLFLSANTDAGDKANKAVLAKYKAKVPSL